MRIRNRRRALALALASAIGAAALSLSAAGSVQDGKSAAAFTFRAEQIASDFGVGYAVTTGDVNGDGRTDVVAINGTDLVWFEAPGWQRRVMLSGVTARDNVTLSLHDIDRDGRMDVALGAAWQPSNTTGGGTLQWVGRNGPGAEAPWELHAIGEEPTLHRIRWADVDGDAVRELVVAPLHGRGTKGPDWQGQGARILIFRPPANPAREPWPMEVADDTLHILHNFLPANMDDDPQEELLTASREGVHLLKRGADRAWTRTLIGEGVPGEIKMGRVDGRRMLATVEPWHGASVVIYAEKPGLWSRSVIESAIAGGHALGWADFDGDGSEELAVGWRDGKPGVALYVVDREGALTSKVMVDEGGMATEDLTVADLNGDKRPEIIASGRATHNVKIYWNETRR
ncbi:MAG: FG-GAP-like repeat-containing protein [Acidobacteriota bacterium]|nr:FG-GAP-like repeat-containing protein [Acidobacteriota bacterium]